LAKRAMAKTMQTGDPASFCGFVLARTSLRKPIRCLGFAYVLLLVLIAVLGLIAGNTVSAGSALARRDAEATLLVIGAEFETALRSYAGVGNARVAPTARGPRSLEELLKDPRSPGIRRHLWQIYADPLTGKPDWGLVKDNAGFIIGVYSQAEGIPIKQEGFDIRQASFVQAQTYQQWVFGLPAAQVPTTPRNSVKP
jgi:type II secretory pathway pseudopilin PulG